MALNLDALLRIKADVQGENNIRRLGNSMQGLQGKVKNAAMGFSSLKGAVAGFGAAIAGSAIVAGLSATVKQAINLGDELGKLSARTGVAQNALIGLRNAAALSDVSNESLAKSLTRLNVNLVKAAEGNEDLAAKFQQLGVNIKTADGQMVTADRALKQIADRFADMPNGAEKAAAAVAIFGKSGADLIPMLNGGSEAMEQFIFKVSDEFAARSERFNDTITILGFKTQGFSLQLADALLPALQEILDVFSDLFATENDWSSLFKVIEVGIRATAVVIYTLVKAVDVLVKNITAAAQATQQAFSGDFAGAWETITSRVESGIKEQRKILADLGRLAFGSADAPSGSLGRNRLGLDTSDLDDRADAANRKAASAAEKAAREQERLEERRRTLGQRALSLQQQLRESLEDLNRAYAGVGADEFQQLSQRRDEAIVQNNRLVDKLTRDVVELALEINAAGGQIDIKPFEDLINAISEGNLALANKEYQQGLQEIGQRAFDASLDLLEFVDAVELQGAAMQGARDGIGSYLESIGTLSENISTVASNAFKGLEDAIVSLTMTGKFSFKDFALSIIQDLTRMVTRMLIIAPLLQFIQSLLPGGPGSGLSGTGALSTTKLFPGGVFANGGTFANGIQPFATGGIVNSPTLFKFANGGAGRLGLMGEAGPEAIIPLKRGADGKLGVAGGGGMTSVVVNVDAKGTSVQGDGGQGEQLGRAISQAVQAELIKQKRPGGLLAAA